MPDLPRKKVGLIACSGEELATGTLSRVAVRLVLEELRPEDTTTLCLPLFLAGENEERAFARVYPTIAVDGCDKWCAQRATDTLSAPVAGSIRVDEALQEMGVAVKPAWRRELDDEGWLAAYKLAEVIAARVDAILGPASSWATVRPKGRGAKVEATCSCGSGLPVTIIQVGDKPVELAALPSLFEQLYDEGARNGETIGDELLRLTEIYNPVPSEARMEYRAALVDEYDRFLKEKEQHV
jgi:hypothetical protein